MTIGYNYRREKKKKIIEKQQINTFIDETREIP